jgi:very-short-patch-repair endonuclease
MRGRYFGGSAVEPEHPTLTESRERGPISIPRGAWLTPEQLSRVASYLEEIDELHESPIEHQFGIAAATVLARAGLRLVPQYELFGYRYDFAILHPRLDQVLALVECDGKEFHSTVEQLANDREKDTAAKSINAFVVRYSGVAITRNPKDCAENLLGILRREWRMV